jgi:hypothetical protein
MPMGSISASLVATKWADILGRNIKTATHNRYYKSKNFTAQSIFF